MVQYSARIKKLAVFVAKHKLSKFTICMFFFQMRHFGIYVRTSIEGILVGSTAMLETDLICWGQAQRSL